MKKLTKILISAVVIMSLGSMAPLHSQVMDQHEQIRVIPMEAREDASLTFALVAVQAVPAEEKLSSEEEGHTQLDQSFGLPQGPLERKRPLLEALKKTTFEFNFRTFYFDRHDFSGSEKQAWAVGGWLGLKTAFFFDHIAFGVTGYTSQPIDAPNDRDGTLLLGPRQEGYTVLGELYADIRIFEGLNITVGRKGYDTPFINRNDVRMTPNTFEAIVLQGRTELGKDAADQAKTPDVNPDGMGLPGLSKDHIDSDKEVAAPTPAPEKDVAAIKYGVVYFNKIKERNDDFFVSMSRDAGADVKRGVFAAGAVYEKGKFSIGAIDYYSDDITNIAYAESK